MRRLNIEFIRSELNKRGYKLLSNVYINSHSNLDIECSKGHRIKTCWTVLKRGGGCVKCLHDSLRMNIGFIRAEFKKEGYILLTIKCINSSQKLDYICPNGHRHSISWGRWTSGCRCGICANNVRLTIDFIREEFKKEGYVLLSTEYINNRTKLKYKCNRKHINYTTWDNWVGRYRCSICWSEDISGPGNPALKGGVSKEFYCRDWTKEYKDYIKERDGYKCLNPYCFKKNGYASELVVHHIDHNKKFCGPENLITICRSCHGYVSKDTGWHQAWYEAILYRRYNYKY